MTQGLQTGRAVVVGASMAGLLAARVLADHCDEVVVVDKDELPDSPGHRQFVPQSHHAHGLLSSGAVALMGLFPGWVQDIAAAGGVTGVGVNSSDLSMELKIYVVRGANVIKMPAWWAGGVLASRTLIEHTVRTRVQALPNVTVRAQTRACGLRTDAANRRVVGVTVDDGVLDADLVVDASGRASQLPAWLQDHGYPAPPTSTIHSDVAYASCVVALDEGFSPEYAVVLGAQAAQTQAAGGVFLRIENDMMHCTLTTIGGGAALPRDPDGYRAFARALSCPAYAEVLENSTMLTDIRPHHLRTNRLAHYERLDRRLAGVIPIGDSVCAFNPAYGQGMSVAAQSALALGDVLAADAGTQRAGFERRVARKVAAAAGPAWTLAVSEDRRLGCRSEGISTARAMQAPFAARFQERLERGAVEDPELAQALGEVIQLRLPLTSLGTPRTLWRTLRGKARPASEVPATSPGGSARTGEPMSVRTDHVLLDAVALHYGEVGPADAETVLFLHGWPDQWPGWEPLMRAVAAAGFRAVAPDQRGCGRSTKPSRVRDYRMELLTADVRQLIDRLDTGPVHLVGHDWGGVVAWATAIERPDLVRSLTIMNMPHPRVFLDNLLGSPGQMLRSWYMAVFQVPALAETLFGLRDAAPLKAMLRRAGGHDPETLERYAQQWRNPGAIRTPLYWYRALFRTVLTDGGELHRRADGPVTVPTQIIWGTRDPVFTLDSAHASAARCDAELHLLDVGHWPQNEARGAVTGLLEGWLDRHRGGAERSVPMAAAGS